MFKEYIMRAVLFVVILLFCVLALAGAAVASKLNYYADVYAWFPDGTVKKASPGDGIYLQACIHPNGTHLIYSGNNSGPPRVWITDLKTGQKKPLTPEGSGARQAVFSWGGKKIAFISDRNFDQASQTVEKMPATGVPPGDSRANIFIMDIDGSNVKQITKGAFLDQRPAFSPEGKYIAFVRTVNKLWRLYVVPIDGSAEPRELPIKGWGYRPWFSVDGKTIYFQTNLDGRNRIVKIPFEGGEVIPLANDDTGMSRGTFTDHDGKSLLIHSTRGGDYGIWEMPLDGSEPKQLIPPGYKRALHPTRSKNGVVSFDAYRMSLEEDSLIKYTVAPKSVSKAAGEYQYPGSPVFSVKFPENFKTKQPNTRFGQVYSGSLPSGFNVQVVVSDIPDGQDLKDAGSAYAYGIIAKYFNSEIEIVLNEERELNGGIKAYLTEFKWEARNGTKMTSYILTAHKDGKLVQVNGHIWGEPDEILKILNSLTFK